MRAALLSLAALVLATPALAQTSCAEQIATIERRLSSEGAVAVTGATGQAPVQGSPRALPAPAGTSSTRSRRPAASTGRATRKPATTP